MRIAASTQLYAVGGQTGVVVVPLKPGDAGGRKGPDFWHAFDVVRMG
jgi:hypothetical protein